MVQKLLPYGDFTNTDDKYAALVDAGYTGTLNDMMYQQGVEDGLTGTLQDMLANPSFDPSPAPALIERTAIYYGNMIDPATTDTVTYTTPLQENDLLLYFGVTHTDQLPQELRPTGFTNIANSGADQPSYSVAYKVVGSTPETTTTIPKFHSTNRDQPWIMMSFRNVDPITPLDTTRTIHGGGTFAQQLPAITTVTDNALNVMLWCLDDDLGSTMVTPPTGYSSDTWSATTTANTLVSLGSGMKLIETAGAQSALSYTLSTTDENWCILVPLRPG